MKKQLFSLVMMLALVIVAGSAMAVNGDKITPYQGATHSYTLSAMVLTENATATMFLSSTKTLTPGLNNTTNGGNWGISSVSTNSGSPTVSPANTSYSIPLTSNETSLTFSVTYGTSLNTGTYYLYVNVVNSAGSCNNYIMQTITVIAAPTLALDLTVGNATVCQKIAAVGSALDNIAASDGQVTTFTYIVTPTPGTIPANTSYNFNFNLDNYTLGSNSIVLSVSDGSIAAGSGSTYNITGAVATSVTITATVNTTTGVAAKTFAGSLNSGSLKADAAVGGASYTATITGTPKTVTIGSTPTIGTFSGL